MKKINYIFLLFALSVSVCVLNACAKDHKEKKKANNNDDSTSLATIKIMSYNIRHGAPIHQGNNDVYLEGIAAVINRQKPDLVALQEVDSVTTRAPFDEAKKLGELTGMHYFFAKAINYQGGGYGIGILSKFPIEIKKKYLLPIPDPSGERRAIAMVEVKIDSINRVYFASTHLDLKEQNRVAQINKMIELSNEKNAPLIIAGDFNATPDAPEIQKLQQSYLFPCMSNCPKTFPSDNPAKTIDYILLNQKASELFQTKIYKVIPGILASNHLPLVAQLEVK